MINSFTLKDDQTFLVSDLAGEIPPGNEGLGLYFQDTRYLSRMELCINGQRANSLSYTADYNIAATYRLSASHKALVVPPGELSGETEANVLHAVGITRRRFVQKGLVETLEFINFHVTPVQLEVSLRLGADFADIFEVRGFPRGLPNHRVKVGPAADGKTVTFRSEPIEGQFASRRVLQVECNRVAERREMVTGVSPLNDSELPEIILYYTLELEPQQPVTLNLHLKVEPEEARQDEPGNAREQKNLNFNQEVALMRRVFSRWEENCTSLETNDYILNKIFKTGVLDLRSLMQQEPQGLVVTAGIPWYFTLFGRDSLITALETLSLNPQIAVDTLRSLAAYQADSFNDWRDSEPGKILHELRRGDMTVSGEMPHGPYYGSIDSTILFILCFAEMLRWRPDPALFTELWPNVQRALEWCEKFGDVDGDGYIEFSRRSKRGILHQGWKDSDESMGGSVGPRPLPPIALVEVQGYYYAAQVGLVEALRRYGDETQRQLAARLEDRATHLKENFNRDFWWEEEGFFAQALDGRKKQVRNVTSNPGHCLWNGIIDQDKAGKVVARLVRPDMLCGWGIRTISDRDHTYNPMSYHNGSVWPHDNALIIAGMRRYGYHAEALKVTQQILDAATTFPDYRLPELYCGFPRDDEQDKAPAAYPVSCSPQAWAAGTPALIIQTLLGLAVDPETNTLAVEPVLLDHVNNLHLKGLRVGNSRLDLLVRHDPETGEIRVTHSQDTGPNSQKINLQLQQVVASSKA